VSDTCLYAKGHRGTLDYGPACQVIAGRQLPHTQPWVVGIKGVIPQGGYTRVEHTDRACGRAHASADTLLNRTDCYIWFRIANCFHLMSDSEYATPDNQELGPDTLFGLLPHGTYKAAVDAIPDGVCDLMNTLHVIAPIHEQPQGIRAH
jgi:hypothetical protein